MSLRFTDEEFQGAWRELDEPQLEGGWELFTETMGVKIYRRYDKVRKINDTGRLRRFGFPLRRL